MSFYYLLVLLLLHQMSLTDLGSNPLLSVHEAAEIAGQVITNVRATGLPLFREFAIEPKRTHMASDIAVETHRFVLSHELAHVALGHIGGSREFVSIGRDREVPTATWSWDQGRARGGGTRPGSPFFLWLPPIETAA